MEICAVCLVLQFKIACLNKHFDPFLTYLKMVTHVAELEIGEYTFCIDVKASKQSRQSRLKGGSNEVPHVQLNKWRITRKAH